MLCQYNMDENCQKLKTIVYYICFDHIITARNDILPNNFNIFVTIGALMLMVEAKCVHLNDGINKLFKLFN